MKRRILDRAARRVACVRCGRYVAPTEVFCADCQERHESDRAGGGPPPKSPVRDQLIAAGAIKPKRVLRLCLACGYTDRGHEIERASCPKCAGLEPLPDADLADRRRERQAESER